MQAHPYFQVFPIVFWYMSITLNTYERNTYIKDRKREPLLRIPMTV